MMLSKIVVRGYGEASGKPDVVDIGVTVAITHRDAATARRQMDETTGRILARLEELGLSRKDIRSRHYWVRPEHRRKKDSDVMIGYDARNALEVTTSSVSAVEQITEALMGAGAKEINFVCFRCSDDATESLRREALRKATIDAADRAGVIAAALSTEIGRVLRVSDESDTSGRSHFLRERALYPGPGLESAQPPEEIAIKGEVEIVFELNQGGEERDVRRGTTHAGRPDTRVSR